MVCLRCLYYSAMGIVTLAVEGETGWFVTFVFLIWLSIVIDAARVVSRSMQDEVRGQTLSSLMMLPRSINQVVYSKITGSLLGWLPAPLIGFLVVVISPSLRDAIGSLLSNSGTGGVAIIMMVLFSALIPHFAALLSLYVRWGAVALAIGISIGVYIVVAMLETVLIVTFGGSGMNGELLVASISMILFSLCAACHFGVLLRVQSLAAK